MPPAAYLLAGLLTLVGALPASGNDGPASSSSAASHLSECWVEWPISNATSRASAKRRVMELEAKARAQIALFRSDVASAASRASRSELQKLLSESEKLLRQIHAIAEREYCPSEVTEAMSYFAEVALRIEECGTRNFPTQNGKKVYGAPSAEYVLNETGNLVAVQITRSSGNSFLDAHAIQLVRASAPFGPVPSQVRSGKYTRFRFNTKFDFVHDPSTKPLLEPMARCKL